MKFSNAEDRPMHLTDANELRNTLGCFTTGVVVATTVGDGGMPVGLTINSFNSVSLDPPLILWSLSLAAPSLSAFRAHSTFAINILSIDQADLCLRFAKSAENKFKDVSWTAGMNGIPLISNALGWLECEVWRRHDGGDHEIIIGEVMGLGSTDKLPLVYHRGRLKRIEELHGNAAENIPRNRTASERGASTC